MAVSAAIRSSAPGDGHRRAAARGVGPAQPHPLDLDRLESVSLSLEGQGAEQLPDLGPFLQGLLDLVGVGRHLGPGAAVEDGHRLGPEAQGGPGRLHGRVAPADDRHPAQPLQGLAPPAAAQEIHAAQDPGEVLSGQPQGPVRSGPQTEEHGREALLFELLQLGRGVDPAIQPQLHPQGQDGPNLRLQDREGQPVWRDALAQQAAGGPLPPR